MQGITWLHDCVLLCKHTMALTLTLTNGTKWSRNQNVTRDSERAHLTSKRMPVTDKI